MRQTFHKEERLRSKKLTEELFKKGSSFYTYPFRITFYESERDADFPAQLLISVPKRIFRNASDRNKLKRLIREAYRKNKAMLYHQRSEADYQLLISLIYTAKTILKYKEIERKIILILQRLIEQDEQTAG